MAGTVMPRSICFLALGYYSIALLRCELLRVIQVRPSPYVNDAY